ncbi:MAG TPA: metalloregulator ArsR/SmtB family transcription factor [Rhizomicrobium sp.]
MTYDNALAALADPTRRAIFEQLCQRPRSVGALAAELPVSRPAVSQHLKILKEAGLVADKPMGTARIYHIDPRGFAVLRGWLDNVWEQARAGFAAEIERLSH